MANDPATLEKTLGQSPSIHRTASVRATTFGRFCEVGARTKVAETSFGDPQPHDPRPPQPTPRFHHVDGRDQRFRDHGLFAMETLQSA